MPRTRLFRVCAAVVISLAVAGAPRLAAAQSASEDGYVVGIPDLPLMPGLNTLPDSTLVFDKPGGRIVDAFAEGSMTVQEVMAFYGQTLPQLGWRQETPGAYLREGERLNLDVSGDGKAVTVHFMLFPQ